MTTDIATIEKNRSEELRIALKEYEGHDYVDIRTFTEPYSDHGQGRVPTKKGITLAVRKLPVLIDAIREAEERARAAGLLKSETEAA